jgi:hypothetical protein
MPANVAGTLYLDSMSRPHAASDRQHGRSFRRDAQLFPNEPSVWRRRYIESKRVGVFRIHQKTQLIEKKSQLIGVECAINATRPEGTATKDVFDHVVIAGRHHVRHRPN